MMFILSSLLYCSCSCYLFFVIILGFPMAAMYVHRDTRDSLAERVSKDVRSVHRAVEKYQDRYSQRKAKHLRPLQERFIKDRLLRDRQLRETYDRQYYPTILKSYTKLETETSGWVTGLVDRIRLGDQEFAQCISALSSSQPPSQQKAVPTPASPATSTNSFSDPITNSNSNRADGGVNGSGCSTWTTVTENVSEPRAIRCTAQWLRLREKESVGVGTNSDGDAGATVSGSREQLINISVGGIIDELTHYFAYA